jgi:hypothetical protein
MLFSSLMLFFLYFGVKNLINKNAAIVMMSLYSFFPFFMDRAHFLWNPNYQFALLPILVYLISLFHFNKKPVLFFLIGLVNGILFQLHYMYSFTLIGIAFYYLIIRRVSLMLSLLFIIGFIIGICNLLIFELRHNFYNLQTLLIYLKHSKQLSSHWFSDYYLTTQIFFLIILLTYLIKKYLNKNSTIILISSLLFITGLYYVTITAKTKNYPKNWHYKDELRVYNIIKKNLDKIKNFNIFEFYVATGTTQKYFLKRDNIKINFNDYYNNNYLYVVYKDKNFWRDPAYEVNSFKPYKILNVWKINNYYNLYLLNRQK